MNEETIKANIENYCKNNGIDIERFLDVKSYPKIDYMASRVIFLLSIALGPIDATIEDKIRLKIHDKYSAFNDFNTLFTWSDWPTVPFAAIHRAFARTRKEYRIYSVSEYLGYNEHRGYKKINLGQYYLL